MRSMLDSAYRLTKELILPKQVRKSRWITMDDFIRIYRRSSYRTVIFDIKSIVEYLLEKSAS